MAERPLGVTIICILQFIGAIGGIVIGALAVLLGLAIASGLLLALGAVILVIGIIAFFVTFGLWKLKSWAFWLTIIINIVSILSSISTALSGYPSAIGGLIIPLIVMIYLFTVKDHFR